MDAVGLGVIGAGYWGPNLARNAQTHPRTMLRWVCDLSLDRATRLTQGLAGVEATADFGDLLDDPLVEAVAIATPASTHSAIAQECLNAGKHVLIEKPLARTVQEGRQVVDLANEKGLVVMCDHTFCYTGAVRKLRSLVYEGTLGSVQYFDSVRINLGLIQPDIDVFWDLAPHDLSILDFILPGGVVPVAISAQGADPLGVGHPCIGYFSMQLSNGAIAHAHLNWLSPTKVRTTIVGGSKKMAVWDDLNPGQRLSIFDTGVELGTLSETELTKALVSYRTGDMIAPVIDGTEALHMVMGEFASAIREGRAPATDGMAGLRVLEELTAIQKSVGGGGSPVPLQVTREGQM